MANITPYLHIITALLLLTGSLLLIRRQRTPATVLLLIGSICTLLVGLFFIIRDMGLIHLPERTSFVGVYSGVFFSIVTIGSICFSLGFFLYALSQRNS